MPVVSFSLLRPYAPPSTAAYLLILRRKFSHLVTTTASRRNHLNHQQQQPRPNKHLTSRDLSRAKHQHLKNITTLTPPPIAAGAADKVVGKVTSAQANFMRVVVEGEHSRSVEKGVEGSNNGGGVELLCVVRAVLKKIKRRVLVGDKVLVGSIDWNDGRGMIENVFPRDSEVLDPPIANADHFLVLFSMKQPKIEPFSLTRFLIEAESTGIPLTLALNKCELVGEEVLVEWKSRLRRWGYMPIFCSVQSKRGLDSLAFILRDRTTVIVGPSGVGKSSVINALRNTSNSPSVTDEIAGSKARLEDQRVGEVSARSGRGKHTTRHVSLLPLAGGGYLADTPGFNQPSLLKVTKHSLAQAFPEIQKMHEENEPKTCAFKNCLHIGEPGCVVAREWERYPYYLQLLDEIKIREEFQLRTLGTKREGDVRNKMGDMGVMVAEPRLEPKKHRRVSRKKMNQSILDDLDEVDDEEDESLKDNPIIQAMEEENQ
ncbi:small ribosomal subunit biogenesis GTPase RsgA 1, mitochondrial [Silene latifolia]|uniref:small ribosomal subunit biogenesis GTPase RsgA 1, mitochondrial n=1 Tax=Silene latifolia TaxID=37657 RepID=UPI003D77FFDC